MNEEFGITQEMVSAGVFALRGLCPFDFAFPVGGEDDAVEAVLIAALRVARSQRTPGGFLRLVASAVREPATSA
jgi:hypothetical protein